VGASRKPRSLLRGRALGFDRTARTIQINSSEIANWNNFAKAEMHLMLMWADSVIRLASYTTSGSVASLKFQSTEDAVLFARPYPQLDFPNSTKYYYFENAFEFLDQPGEWYLDETTNVLYYKPRTGEDLTTGHGGRADGGEAGFREGDQHLRPGGLSVVSGADLRPCQP
jgi:hypothetical protein